MHGPARFEFSKHLRDGDSLRAEVPLIGGGTGFAITARGHILTRYHPVMSEIGIRRRAAVRINVEAPCRRLRVQIADPTSYCALHAQINARQSPPRQRAPSQGAVVSRHEMLRWRSTTSAISFEILRSAAEVDLPIPAAPTLA